METSGNDHVEATDRFQDLTEADLPPLFNRRWSPVMKARVVVAIEIGLISATEAMGRYALSLEELTDWQGGFSERGVPGLTVAARADRHKQSLKANVSLGAGKVRRDPWRRQPLGTV